MTGSTAAIFVLLREDSIASVLPPSTVGDVYPHALSWVSNVSNVNWETLELRAPSSRPKFCSREVLDGVFLRVLQAMKEINAG